MVTHIRRIIRLKPTVRVAAVDVRVIRSGRLRPIHRTVAWWREPVKRAWRDMRPMGSVHLGMLVVARRRGVVRCIRNTVRGIVFPVRKWWESWIGGVARVGWWQPGAAGGHCGAVTGHTLPESTIAVELLCLKPVVGDRGCWTNPTAAPGRTGRGCPVAQIKVMSLRQPTRRR